LREDKTTGVEATVAASSTDPALDATVAPEGSTLVTQAPRIRSSSAHLAAGAQLGRYVVLSQLGAGGMGEVYATYDPVLDRRVAVKVIRPSLDDSTLGSAKALLLAEAQALAKLSHPNVVAVYDVGTVGDDVYIAMELVDGTTLKAWLAAPARSWQEIVTVLAAVGRGLEAAHAVGLVHRDVKPDNIILGKDGRPRLLDFGVALAHKPGEMTKSGIAGTPAYMAPEQFQDGDIGPHTDQFSFGVTLYEALWTKRPFAGDTLVEIADNVCEGRVIEAPPGDVPAFLRAAVMRSLAKDPAQRFPTMGGLLAAIEPPVRRRALPFIVAGAAVAVAAVAIVATTRHRPDPCAGFSLDSVWDSARAAKVQSTGARKALDDYARGWLDHEVAVCRATEQSEAVRQQRMACLDTRRRQLDATVTLLASGEVKPGQAVQMASGLESLAGCDTLAALPGGRPDGPTAALDAVEDGLARAHALRLAGKYKDARTVATRVLTDAEKLNWGRIAAQAVYERAAAEYGAGEPAVARESLFETIRRGEQADDWMSEAQAWILLVGVEGGVLSHPDEALRWAKHAEIALAKAGGDEEWRANLLANTAITYNREDRYEDALALQKQAIELYRHALGPDHYRVAVERGLIANSYRHLGRLDEAAREGEAALHMTEQLLGATHPSIAIQLGNLALTYRALGRLDEARHALERSLAIKEQELGPTHVSLAVTLGNLADLDRRAGDFAAADARWQRAYDIRIATLGEHDTDVTLLFYEKALDRERRGMNAEAYALIREVASRYQATNDSHAATALAHRCELERRLGHADEARASCAAAIKALGAKPDPDDAVLVYTYAARRAEGEPQAQALLDQARAALAKLTTDVRARKALVDWAASHLNHDAALAREARDGFLAEGKATPWFVDDLR
jgi:tetratricopeptide (TPR) repeat protein/tRNA A-37 threonylcarbamoyl transferase component Bud32